MSAKRYTQYILCARALTYQDYSVGGTTRMNIFRIIREDFASALQKTT